MQLFNQDPDRIATVLAAYAFPITAMPLAFSLPFAVWRLGAIDELPWFGSILIPAALSLSIIAITYLFRMARPRENRDKGT